ncbi:MAG: hypothetical protein GY774_35480 [Planctomycetes bacterium]|nr:hypothetical protein [Planctomycetota bacterium]
MNNGTSVEPERISQVRNQMEALDIAIGRLTQMSEKIESKFSCVLTPPSPATPEGTKDQDLVPFASDLRSFCIRLSKLEAGLDDLLERTEL